MGLIIAFWIYNANITMAKTVWLPWDHVLPCGWPENQPVVRAPCNWSCMGRVAFCLKYNYIFLWQKRHNFNRIVFAQGAGSVVGVPHFEFMIFTLPWPERCDCPGAMLSCDWSENQSRCGSLWLVLQVHESCRVLNLNILYIPMAKTTRF